MFQPEAQEERPPGARSLLAKLPAYPQPPEQKFSPNFKNLISKIL
jgi:hypothetical protein